MNDRYTPRSARLVATILTLTATWSPLLLAQTQGASDSTLEEVVVTAEHRSADVQKTAIPMSVVTGAEIAKKGQTTIDEVLRDVPAIQIQSSPQGADVVLRGVGGNDTGGISQDPDVSTFTDSVYSGLSATNLGSLYDVGRVEVLRGPQGTLYGRNSAGGAINILTNDPGSAFGAGVNVGVGSLNYRHLDAYVNLPASSTLGFRIAVDRDLRDGYYSNGAGELNNAGVRLKGKWTPSDAFSLLARIDYWRQQGYTETTVPIANSGAPPPFLPTHPENPWNAETSFPLNAQPVGNDNKIYTYSLQADWNLGFGTLTVIPTYTRSTQIQYGCGGLFINPPGSCTTVANGNTVTGKQQTLEARLASPESSAIKWVIGAYSLDNKADQAGPAPGGAGGVSWYATQSSNARPSSSYAGFGQLTYPFSDKLRGTVGARYTVDEKKVLYGVCSSVDGVTCDGRYTSPVANIKNSYNSSTYKLGVEYDLNPTAMAYLQVSSGYKAGGYSTAITPPTPYLPEKLVNVEFGIKSRLLDDKLELNGDIYFYNYKDQQIELHPTLAWTDILPAQYIPAAYLPGGAQANTYTPILDVNAGDSKFKGVEAQMRYQITAHDLFSLSATYNHAVYGHFVVPIGGGPPGINYGTATSYDLTGKQEGHAPLWSGNVGYQHVFEIGGNELTFNGNVRLQTENYTTIQQWFANGHTIQPGYHQSDLNVTYGPKAGNWSVGVWGKNLENNAVVTYVYPFFRQTLDISRTYGANVSYKY
jgi:iron complex outermembrane receptor protein